MLRHLALVALLMLGSMHAAAQPGYGRGGADSIACESRDYQRARCDVPWRDARLVEQISETSCRRGSNWDFDRRGIWVDGGCAAVFVEAGRGRDSGYDDGDRDRGRDRDDWRPGGDWDSSIRVRCESDNYDYHMCSVDTGRGSRVFIEDQISRTQCSEGRNWGWNRAGIWVSDGCAAIFVVERRWR